MVTTNREIIHKEYCNKTIQCLGFIERSIFRFAAVAFTSVLCVDRKCTRTHTQINAFICWDRGSRAHTLSPCSMAKQTSERRTKWQTKALVYVWTHVMTLCRMIAFSKDIPFCEKWIKMLACEIVPFSIKSQHWDDAPERTYESLCDCERVLHHFVCLFHCSCFYLLVTVWFRFHTRFYVLHASVI